MELPTIFPARDGKQHPRMTQDQPFPYSEPDVEKLHRCIFSFPSLKTGARPSLPEVVFKLVLVLL